VLGSWFGKLLALTSAFIWAFAVILFKRAGDAMRPVPLTLYKTVIAFVLLLPVMWFAGAPLIPPEVNANDWIMVSLSGIIGISIADCLFFICLNLLGAGLTAIVDCLYSPMVIGLSWILLAEPLGMEQMGGAALVIIAVLAATFERPEKKLEPKQVALGVLSGAGAMFFMAWGIVQMKPALTKTSVFWVTELRLLAAMLVLVIMILVHKKRNEWFGSLVNLKNWRHALPATILGNVLAMTLWVAAFKFTDVSSAAILNQTNTIFIVILATVILKEPFTPRRIIASLLAVGGSILVLIN
jgi:drug/metabolite transporter (DMT)-like permease